MTTAKINSPEYWNKRFTEDWESLHGSEQTAFFSELAIELMPSWMRTFLGEPERRLLDWGCALGDAAPVFREHFPALSYTGYDVAADGIARAKEKWPQESFTHRLEDLEQESFDVVFTSNTLEHFTNPYTFFPELAGLAASYVVILVPFEEYQRISEHEYTFDMSTLYAQHSSLHLVAIHHVDTEQRANTAWLGKQILLIYAKDSIKEDRSLKAPLSETLQLSYQSINEEFVLMKEELQAVNTALQTLQAELAQQHAHTLALEKRNNTLQAKLDDMQGELQKQERELTMIHNSLTWKILSVYKAVVFFPGKLYTALHRLAYRTAKIILPQKIQKMILSNLALFRPSYYLHRRKHRKELQEILAAHPDRKGILIYPPTIDWGFLFQRPQQLTRAFAAEGYLCFYCTGNFTVDKIEGFEKKEEGVYVTNDYEVLKDIEDPILLISWAINKSYLLKYPYKQYIYDYIDELDIFHMYDKNMITDHERLVKNADVAVATADKLFKQIAPLTERAILSPNGVMLEDFISKETPAVPKDLAPILAKNTKIIGYYGALAEWFDYDLLREVAKQAPDYDFVLIGPYYDGSAKQYDWSTYSNIHFLGSKEYAELKKYSYYFDVATIPFKINKITESTSPVKLFEYMAQGLPIVTTPMLECKKYASVFLASTAEEFVSQLQIASTKKTDPEYTELLMKEAKENTWQARVQQMIKALEKAEKEKMQ